jgi:hypothetical protein
MKLVVGLLSLALSFSTLASSGESKTFTYDGSQDSVELILRGEKTHTEYRTEVRTTTCFRTEIVGYRTICNGGGYPGPGPRPYPGGGRNCWREPVYRQVAYPCQQTVQIPYEVKDFDVDARVMLDVSKISMEATPGESFTVSLLGDTLSLTANGSKKFFLVLNKQDIRSRMNGTMKFMDALYSVELIESVPVLKALKMTDISLSNDVLTFGLGPVNNNPNIAFSLNIEKKKLFGSDEVLFDRELTATEIVIKASNTGSAADVNIDRLGVSLEDGKYTLTAKAYFKAKGSLLNASQYGDDLEASKTLVYKIR